MMIVIMMMIASYAADDDHHHYDDRIIMVIMMIASYIRDDVRIVYSLANTMRSFSVTDEQGDSRSRIIRRFQTSLRFTTNARLFH